MRAIGDNVVELSMLALIAFAFWGMGYLIITGQEDMNKRYELCISAGKQYVEGSCVE